jgi:hypothetical protein
VRDASKAYAHDEALYHRVRGRAEFPAARRYHLSGARTRRSGMIDQEMLEVARDRAEKGVRVNEAHCEGAVDNRSRIQATSGEFGGSFHVSTALRPTHRSASWLTSGRVAYGESGGCGLTFGHDEYMPLPHPGRLR